MTVETVASPEHCPVSALAREARRLIAAHDALDALSLDPERDHAEDQRTIEVLAAALDGIVDRASWLETRSAGGALFQLCAIAAQVDRLATRAGSAREAEAESAAIYRLLHSVAALIEETAGHPVSLSENGGDYWLDRRLSAHARLARALSLSDGTRPT